MTAKTQKYQIKISLKEAKPPIWRRLWVPSNIDLASLHEIIQIAMGWENYHMHQFFINGEYYGPDISEMDDMEWNNEQGAVLSAIFGGEQSKILYEYDFGDGWVHEILLEKILPLDKKEQLPICIKGKRACPPEDCGGIWGYENLLEALADPKHAEHEEMLGWIGGTIDPEAFSIDDVNTRF
jgi:hypothetical protein